MLAAHGNILRGDAKNITVLVELFCKVLLEVIFFT